MREGFILAGHNQTLLNRNSPANVNQNVSGPECSFCCEVDETRDHFLSRYSVLIPNESKNRHERVGKYLHWEICKYYKHSDAANVMMIILSQSLKVKRPLPSGFFHPTLTK